MSADLPTARFESSDAMARVLVTYMADERAVRSACRQEFAIGPTLGTIRKLRAAHLASLEKAPEPAFKPHDGYYPAEAAEKAAEASHKFLHAIERERAISVEWAKANGALKSPLLERPELVDKLWEREAEQAWRENTEWGG